MGDVHMVLAGPLEPLPPDFVRWFSYKAALGEEGKITEVWRRGPCRRSPRRRAPPPLSPPLIPPPPSLLPMQQVPHRGSLLRFCAADSAALENAYRCRPPPPQAPCRGWQAHVPLAPSQPQTMLLPESPPYPAGSAARSWSGAGGRRRQRCSARTAKAAAPACRPRRLAAPPMAAARARPARRRAGRLATPGTGPTSLEAAQVLLCRRQDGA